MYSYSRGEKESMTSSFAKVFNVPKEVAAQPAAWEWMSKAAVGIVEYDGTLKGEKATDRDRRMEIVEVYDGSISTLVQYLKTKFPHYKKVLKWELIFKIYADICEVKSVIERATTQNAFGTSGETETQSTDEEANQNDQDVSTVAEAESVESKDVTPEVEMPQPAKTEESSPVTPEDVQTAQVAGDSVEQPSGNVQDTDDTSVYKETTNPKSMEEHTMSEVTDLLNKAQGEQANPAEAQSTGAAVKSNAEISKADLKAAQVAVSEQLSGEKAKRDSWTRSNTVKGIISTAKPNAIRRKADTGRVTKETDPEKAATQVKDKLTGFIHAVSGKKDITIEQFDAAPDYSNVVPGEVAITENLKVANLDRAKAIYAELKKAAQDPMGYKAKAYIPAKLSYPIKGYVVGNDVYSTDEFIVHLCDNSNGAIYGEGGVTADGTEIEGATSFKIATAKKTEKAKGNGIAATKTEKKVVVIRIKNKANFIEGGKHVEYLFTKEDDTKEAFASFRAAIDVNGTVVPAGVAVYTLDENGNKIVNGNNQDGTPRYRTKQASMSVSVPVSAIVKEFAPEFKGEMDIIQAANRWGVTTGTSKAATGDFCNVKEFSQEPAFNVFAEIFAGGVTLPDTLKKSKTLQDLRAAADQSAAAEAAEAVDALA